MPHARCRRTLLGSGPHLLLLTALTACPAGGADGSPPAEAAAHAATDAPAKDPAAPSPTAAPAAAPSGGAADTATRDAAAEAAPAKTPAAADAAVELPTGDTGGVSSTSSGLDAPPTQDADNGAGAAAGTNPAADATTGGAEADPDAKLAALMAEIGSTKTPDERVFAAIEEALALEASAGRVGRAVNRRAARLFETPERAIAMYEWSRANYTNSPVASFELAKYACNTGDIDATITLLEEVKARGGREQLQTVSFDPTFALVVNESRVQALLR